MISLSALMFMRLVMFYSETQIRLTGHSAPNAGRVEVRLHGIWGRVSSLHQSYRKDFGQEEAAVVCRQLGFPGVIAALRDSAFGDGSGLFMMSGVECVGTETSIAQCRYRDWMKIDNCGRCEAGVVCKPHGHDPDISDIPVRLQGSSALNSGRVEILYAGVWGGIDGYDWETRKKWDINSAHVVCRQLGYQAGAEAALTNSVYGPVSGPVWLTNVQCSGSESNSMSCSHDGIGNKSEKYWYWQWRGSNVANVICKDLSSLRGMHVRLRGFHLPSTGRVEVHYAGQWALIDGSNWDINDANVVCRQLGYLKALSSGKGIYCSKATQCWFTNFRCNGNETLLDRCARDFHSSYYSYNCASVMCKNGSIEGPGMRLSGSQVPHAGRVELLYNSLWGSIAFFRWSGYRNWTDVSNNARVICRQLNFVDLVAVIPWFIYGPSQARLAWLEFSDIRCSGSESSILECTLNKQPEMIGHYYPLGIVCKPDTPQANDFNVRLVGSSLPHTGTLEVLYYGVWGGVLGGGHFSISVGHVVCRQLGYPGAEKVFQYNVFLDMTRFLWIHRINCTGDETHFSQCTYVTWDKVKSYSEYDYQFGYYAAGVICNVTQSFTNLKVRLAGSPIKNAGRVEVLYQGVWGIISSYYSDINWNHNDAIVMCRQLGYPGVISYGETNQFGYTTGPAWFCNVQCVGNEASLDQCAKDFYGFRKPYFAATVHCRLKQESDCANTTCENNGTCVNTGADAICNCTEGFMGIHCEIGTVRSNKLVNTSQVERDALVVAVSVLAALVLLLTAVLVYVTLKYRRVKKQPNVPSLMFNNEAFRGDSQNDPREDESSHSHDLDLGTRTTHQHGEEIGKNDKQGEGRERSSIPPPPVELGQMTGPNSCQYQSVSGGSGSNTYMSLSLGAAGDRNCISIHPSHAIASGTDGNLQNGNEMKTDADVYEELPC